MDESLRSLLEEPSDEPLAERLDAYITQHYAPLARVTELTAENRRLRDDAETTRKQTLLRDGLRKLGVADPDYVIYRMHGVEGFTYDDAGQPTALDAVVKDLARQGAALFPQKQSYRPGAGEAAADNPFAPESFNLTRQGELLRKHPDVARSLAAAAGVRLNTERR